MKENDIILDDLIDIFTHTELQICNYSMEIV